MGDLEFTSLLIVVATAFAAPLLLGLVPALRLPAVVLEIVAGIVIGPIVLGWVEIDDPIRVLATIGLAFLLFLAGLEIEFHQVGGKPTRLAAAGFGVSFAIAVVAGLLLDAAGTIETPFVAIVLTARSLGVVVPVLKTPARSPRRSASSSSPPPRSQTSARSSSYRCSTRARRLESVRSSCCSVASPSWGSR